MVLWKRKKATAHFYAVAFLSGYARHELILMGASP